MFYLRLRLSLQYGTHLRVFAGDRWPMISRHRRSSRLLLAALPGSRRRVLARHWRRIGSSFRLRVDAALVAGSRCSGCGGIRDGGGVQLAGRGQNAVGVLGQRRRAARLYQSLVIGRRQQQQVLPVDLQMRVDVPSGSVVLHVTRHRNRRDSSASSWNHDRSRWNAVGQHYDVTTVSPSQSTVCSTKTWQSGMPLVSRSPSVASFKTIISSGKLTTHWNRSQFLGRIRLSKMYLVK